VRLLTTPITAMLVFFTCAHALAASAPGAEVRELFRQPFPEKPGTDVVMLEVDYPPGGATSPHEHPGYVYAYVLAGAVVSQVGNAPPHTFTQGQMWSELPHQQHLVSKNASSTQPAKLLVFFIVPHATKLTTFPVPSA